MKLLPNRNISLPYPVPAMRGVCGDLIPSEESVGLWLGAWPGLLGWGQSLNWISTRVVDSRKRSLDDLWGLDSIGSLLIAKITIDRGDAPDPFASLVEYVKSASIRRQWTHDALRARWLKYSRINSFAQEAIKQLQLAYCASFVPLIGSDSYQQSIESALKMRNDVGNPLPVFVGMVASPQANFSLSPKALKNFELLQKHLGSDRVLLRVLSARLTAKGLLLIRCRSPEGDVAQVVTRALPNAPLDRRRSRRTPC